MSSAVYCYQQLMKMKEELQYHSLNLIEFEVLGTNFPQCSGPGPSDNQHDVPDVYCVNNPDYFSIGWKLSAWMT